MKPISYQRLVMGYHGCEREVRDQVLAGKESLKTSANDYDWLGRGIYFWEYGAERALEWAENLKRRGRLKNPSVVGALFYLGNCFDLLDVRYTRLLGAAYLEFLDTLEASGKKLPRNSPLTPEDPDFLLRRGDCAVINWTVDRLEEAAGDSFQTVRGVFQEGEPAFPDSYIRQKSHIQVAVRDPSCIVGYFLPT
jgi:hypothetical protein